VDAKTLAKTTARARLLKALGHPTRLFIIDQLTQGERCVCELTAMIGADISTVSKHLMVLRAAGLVLDSRRGPQVYYSLRGEGLEPVLAGLEELLRSIAQEQFQLAEVG
jgi:DNA-binding transcriptional ArsR family regulator